MYLKGNLKEIIGKTDHIIIPISGTYCYHERTKAQRIITNLT
jgi:hypothetical protein